MPRRSLLSAEQRARQFDVPTTSAEMAKHYVLSQGDLLLVHAKRRSMNRLGLAMQLCLLRHPGQGLGPGQQPPTVLLDFVAGQLGIPAAAFADYARRDQTRREHGRAAGHPRPSQLPAERLAGLPEGFQSNVPHDPLLAAIDLLKAADESGARALPKRLPSAFLPPKWRRMIFAGSVPDRRLYETAVLAILRDRLRGAGVWVAGSRDHRAFEDYLLPAEAAGTPTVGIAGEADPQQYVAARAGLLHELLQFVAACAARGELDGVDIEDGSLYIARTKPTVPDAARLMAGICCGESYVAVLRLGSVARPMVGFYAT